MDLEANPQVSSSTSVAGLSRQLAALKLVNKDSARRLEIAADDLALAQAVRRCVACDTDALFTETYTYVRSEYLRFCTLELNRVRLIGAGKSFALVAAGSDTAGSNGS